MADIEQEREAALADLRPCLCPGWQVEASSVGTDYVWVRVFHPKYPIINVLGRKVTVPAEAYLKRVKGQWIVTDTMPPGIHVLKEMKE